MSDQEQKGQSKKKDADEEEPSAEDTSGHDEGADEKDADDEKGSEAGSDDADDEESEEDADGDEKGSEEAGDEEDEPSEEDAARAQRVADALGVGVEEPEAKAEDAEEPAGPPNRAARRAEAAQRRKKRKTGAAEKSEKSATDDDEAPLPKDKNARAKELLKRRREQATEARPIQLLPGEMVDDALARSSSALSKWIRENFGIIQWVILGALAAGGGYLFYQSRVDKGAANATAALMAGVSADRGRVMAEDKRTDDEKEADPGKVYKTADERTDTALAAYQKVMGQHGGTAAATLARLGEAGDYLDKHDYIHALEGFSAVAASPLAGADLDVKARALEGLGFAKEGKGDLDGALSTFKELEGLAGYKELGLYQQGRVWLGKGDKDKAKDFLKQAHDKLEQPTTEGQGLHYLQQMTDEALRRIDPSLVPARGPTLGGPKGGAVTADELEKLKRKLEEAMKQQKGDKH